MAKRIIERREEGRRGYGDREEVGVGSWGE